jgi:hypothetical protein
MEYKIEDFRRLRVNIFNGIPEFLDLKIPRIDNEILSKWIVFCFDKNSPYVKDYDDFRRRAVKVMVDLEATNKDNKLKKQYMDVVMGRHKDMYRINLAIIEYLKLQNNHLFTQVAMYQKTISTFYDDLLSSEEAKDKKDIITSINLMSKTISENMGELVVGSEDKTLYEDIMDEVNNYNLELSVEDLNLKRSLREQYKKEIDFYGGWEFERFTHKDLSDDEYEDMKREMSNDTDDAREFFKAIGQEAEMEVNIKRQGERLNEILKHEEEERKG